MLDISIEPKKKYLEPIKNIRPGVFIYSIYFHIFGKNRILKFFSFSTLPTIHIEDNLKEFDLLFDFDMEYNFKYRLKNSTLIHIGISHISLLFYLNKFRFHKSIMFNGE